MKYLLDANAWIDSLRRPHGKVAKRVLDTPPRDIAMCTVVLGELLFGAYKSSRVEENLLTIDALATQFPFVRFDKASAYQFGRIRADLEKLGTPIGPYDSQIASIALAKDLTVVTHNVREFSRVDGLKIEDWSI